MTEILVDGETVYIDDGNITGTNVVAVQLVKNCYVLQRIPNYGLEYSIAMCAVNNLGAKIISGDALTSLKPKKGNLY